MHVTDQIVLYLDDELQGEERALFEAHLAVCSSCRMALEEERRLIAVVRQARPLYPLPPTLPARLAQVLRQAASGPSVNRWRILRPWLAAAAVVLAAVAIPLVWRATHAPFPGPSEVAQVAVQTHQRYVRGQLPLEIQSHSPEEVSRWFENKVPFNLKLPNYPESPGQPKPYELQGARLISFHDDYAAYICYQLQGRPISLLVTSATTARPAGGQIIRWGGLDFHFDALNGWKVLTWTDQGLTYALVSDFEERGQASCIVCHPGPQDRPMFEGLKLR
ncbi:MAG TPA: zf-HC2 domain-containing protein [Blastocatellia bacterium]|nr:zf-HC2 domain-containing protein [Blastocatellia bacterium]